MRKVILIIAAIAFGMGCFVTSSALAASPKRVERIKKKKARVIKNYDDNMKQNPKKTTKILKKRTKRQAKKRIEKVAREAGATGAQVRQAKKEVEKSLEENIMKDASPRKPKKTD